jgi:hypothetical protein
MGVMTRQQGVKYVITSDRTSDEVTTKRAPRLRADVYQVWTGVGWSVNSADALSFDSLDDADEYVRANYVKVTAKC